MNQNDENALPADPPDQDPPDQDPPPPMHNIIPGGFMFIRKILLKNHTSHLCRLSQ